MDSRLKALIGSNFLFHINNFVLIVLISIFGLNSVGALWFFTPFIFILFTTSIIEGVKEKSFVTIKKMSIIDLGLRCSILIINFLVLSKLINLSLGILIPINVVFMTLNFYVEWSIHRRLPNQKSKSMVDDVLTKEEINYLIDDYVHDKKMLKNKTPSEKKEIIKSFHSVIYVGYSNILIAILVGVGIFSLGFFGIQNRWIVFLVAFLLLVVYLALTEKKIRTFYKNEKQRRLINLRDNITFIIGMSIIYILQGVIYIEESTFNFFGIFLACLFFLPTFKTDQLIRKDFHTMHKS